ncbi:MAG: hypothetical protein ACI8PZ_006137 [Myxococcota bacterium]
MKDIVMGTDVVESTIEQLGARMKGAGMRWSVARGQNVRALRCLLLSEGGWDRFKKRVCDAHEATTSLHVPAISPTRIVTVHDAVSKASLLRSRRWAPKGSVCTQRRRTAV